MQEAKLQLSKGDWVCHPRMPGWGYGKILELTGGTKGRVLFLLGGEKKLSWEHAGLVLVESDAASQAALSEQLAGFKRNLAIDLLISDEFSRGVTRTQCDPHSSLCELCKCSSENLRIYSLAQKGKMCICDTCRDKIMQEAGNREKPDESIAGTEKRSEREASDKVAKKKLKTAKK